MSYGDIKSVLICFIDYIMFITDGLYQNAFECYTYLFTRGFSVSMNERGVYTLYYSDDLIAMINPCTFNF